MKKFFAFFLIIALLFSPGVYAAESNDERTVTHALSCDGHSVILASPGDIITVTYTMYSSESFRIQTSQNEIYYDHNFFELVDKSQTTVASQFNSSEQIKSTGKHYLYFNTMSSRGIATTGTVIGTFQLKVLAGSGSSTVTNTSCMASWQTSAYIDKKLVVTGSGNYTCALRNLTVFVGGSLSAPVAEAGNEPVSKCLLAYYLENGQLLKYAVFNSADPITLDSDILSELSKLTPLSDLPDVRKIELYAIGSSGFPVCNSEAVFTIS